MAKRLPAVVDCLTALGAYPLPQLQEVASELAATSTLIEPHDELLTSLPVAYVTEPVLLRHLWVMDESAKKLVALVSFEAEVL
jgi:hypothetical protein